jgi:hypothetical protein
MKKSAIRAVSQKRQAQKPMKRSPLKSVSVKQAIKQANWNNLVDFISEIPGYVMRFYGIHTECCGQLCEEVEGAHIIPKGRGGAWNAGNCLLVSRWCGCHDHQQFAHGLKMSIQEASEIAKKRNEKYGINPEYNGSKEMNPYLVLEEGKC